jgi:hypothetical protein
VAAHQQEPGRQLCAEADGVGRDEDAFAVEPVRPHTGRQREQREGQELRSRHQRHLRHVAADRQHREGQHDAGDPVTEDGQHLAAEQQAVLRLVPEHGGHAWTPRHGGQDVSRPTSGRAD